MFAPLCMSLVWEQRMCSDVEFEVVQFWGETETAEVLLLLLLLAIMRHEQFKAKGLNQAEAFVCILQ